MYFLSLFDSVMDSVPAIGIFIKCMFLFIVCFNLLIDYIGICVNSRTSSSQILFSETSDNSNFDFHEYRIFISCLIYGLGCMFAKFNNLIYNSDLNYVCSVAYKRLFHNKSYFKILINCYSIVIIALNLFLIAMTIPNIKNPGPLNNLNVLYGNVEGFVDLSSKSAYPGLFKNKVSDFQCHLFHTKPDIVVLNETWLMSHILDSEIFPNKSYKVFRRDRSKFSHPMDPKNKNKFKTTGGGVLLAFRSDLELKATEFEISNANGGAAKAEILSVVFRSGTGPKVCISTLYRVGTLGEENLNEVNRHLRAIAKNKSIHKHILLGDLNLSQTSWPDGKTNCGLQNKFIDLFQELYFDQLITAQCAA